MTRYTRASICVISAVALLFAAGPLLAQTELNGAWQGVDVWGRNTDGDWKLENVQPSLYLFLDGYYSIMYVAGDEPRPLMPDTATRSTITEEQMRSIFMTFVANSGTYEVDGSAVTTKPMVALWPNFMEGGSETFTYRIENDALFLTSSGEGWEFTVELRRLE